MTVELFEKLGLTGTWGTVVGVAAVALAVSPTLRKRARQAMVSATASLIDLADEIRSMGAEAVENAQAMAQSRNGDVPHYDTP